MMSSARPTGQRPSPRPRTETSGEHGDSVENGDSVEHGENSEHGPAVEGDGDTEQSDRDTRTTESTAAERDADDPCARSDSEQSEPNSGRTRRLRPRPRVLLAALLASALLGGAGYLGWQYFSLRAEETAREQAMAAADSFATELSSYDFNELRENFDGVTRDATPRFAEQYQQVGDKLTELIKKHQAVSKGEVVASGVQSFEQDRAVVVLFVDQTISNTNSPQPRIDRNRMRMTLVRQDDRWLVDDVALL